MTEFAEEQRNELEALESIYLDEFKALEENEYCITIEPEESNEECQYTLALKFKYTPKYPDELPEFDIEVERGDLAEDILTRLNEELTVLGNENLGMGMIFAMVSHLKEELNKIVQEAERVTREEEEEKARKKEAAERARFEGTRVTLDQLKAWQAKFEKEVLEIENQEEEERRKSLKNKLTGRQLFEQDRSLALSDAKLMEEGDMSVDVSEFEKEDRQASEDEQDDKDAVWRRFEEEEE